MLTRSGASNLMAPDEMKNLGLVFGDAEMVKQGEDTAAAIKEQRQEQEGKR